jgi:hypothetical protein
MGSTRTRSSSRLRQKAERKSDVDSAKGTGKIHDTNEILDKGNENGRMVGSGMTIWWLLLSTITLFFRFEQEIRVFLFQLDSLPIALHTSLGNWIIATSPISTNSLVRLLQGVSTVSALCVCGCYYTFKLCFRRIQGSMAFQLWSQGANKVIPFWAFYVFDILVHVVIVGLMTYYWYKHVDVLSALIAYVFHRMWSWVHSRGDSVYFCKVEEVYGFQKPMPTWSYVLLYASETIIIGYSIIQAHMKYYGN